MPERLDPPDFLRGSSDSSSSEWRRLAPRTRARSSEVLKENLKSKLLCVLPLFVDVFHAEPNELHDFKNGNHGNSNPKAGQTAQIGNQTGHLENPKKQLDFQFLKFYTICRTFRQCLVVELLVEHLDQGGINAIFFHAKFISAGAFHQFGSAGRPSRRGIS